MNNGDFLLNDTLDNFIFPEGLSQPIISKGTKKNKKIPEENQISFDDSAFLNDLTFDFDALESLDSSQNVKNNVCFVKRKPQGQKSSNFNKSVEGQSYASEKQENSFELFCYKDKSSDKTPRKISENVDNENIMNFAKTCHVKCHKITPKNISDKAEDVKQYFKKMTSNIDKSKIQKLSETNQEKCSGIQPGKPEEKKDTKKLNLTNSTENKKFPKKRDNQENCLDKILFLSKEEENVPKIILDEPTKNVKESSEDTTENSGTDIEYNKINTISTISTDHQFQKVVTEREKENSKNILKNIQQSNQKLMFNSMYSKNTPSLELSSQKCQINSEMLKMSSWGLPSNVLDQYKSRKINSMFPWQVECLTNSKVLHKMSNLIFSAPTSAGKTLVSEILALKTIFERKKKVLLILPFVSIVREKMYYFQDILGTSGIRAEGFMGSYNPPGGFSSIQLAICTIEKANSLVNRLLEEGKLSDIGAVLVDEMHLLGDPHRGYLLELLLTKLRYISLKDENVQIQIIGMSATLPNLDQLAKWLGAELYSTTFRPIPLHEQVIVNGEIFDKQLKMVRKLDTLPDIGTDSDNVLQLCLETIKENCSVLIFCPTKNWCENLAQQISNAISKIGSLNTELGLLLRSQIKGELVFEVLEQLKFCPIGLDEILRKTVSFGVAYHHAGLTMDERDIIEGAFRNGAVRVLIATSTLSSGVNLPARRVIIRTPNFHGKSIDLLTYRQMIGRAGRLGKDTLGESFLICQKNDYNIAKELVTGELPPVESCLEGDGKLKRAILEVIASGVASSPQDVNLFTKCTLLASVQDIQPERNKESFSEPVDKLDNPIDEALNFLITNEFIRLQKTPGGEQKYVATNLAKACLSSSIAPDEGLALFTELERARQCFVLETELHLIYLVTPYSACYSWGNIDWMFYMELYDKLSRSMKKVGELIGVREGYLVSATRGKVDTNSKQSYQKLMIHKRFFVALALQDLVNEMPLGEVCAKFNCNRGMLQSLQQSASTFAGMVTSFSRQLGWTSVEILLSQFQDRMQFGVSRDLLDLMRLPSLNGKFARTLFNAGVETTVQLANADIDTIESILYKSIPFESTKQKDGESKNENKQRNKLRTVFVTGKDGLTEREAAELLIVDARKYLQIEMGLKEAKWTNETLNDFIKESHDNKKISENSHCQNLLSLDNPNTKFQEIQDSRSRDENNSRNTKEIPKQNSEHCEGQNETKCRENNDLLNKSKDCSLEVEETPDQQIENISADSTKIDNLSNSLMSSLDLNISTNSSPNCDKNNIVLNTFSQNLINLAKLERSTNNICNIILPEILPEHLDSEIFQTRGLNNFNDGFKNCDLPKNEEPLNYLKSEKDKSKTCDFDMSDSSLFEDINFTNIEEVGELKNNNTKIKNIADNISINDKKTEVSQALILDSSLELNISESSASNHSTKNLRLENKLTEDLLNSSEENARLDKAFSAEILQKMVNENTKNDLLKTPKRKREKVNSDSENSLLEATPTKKKKSFVGTPKPCSSVVRNLSQLSLQDKNDEYIKVAIIDVTKNEQIFNIFQVEVLEQKNISFSIACSKLEENRPVIGNNILGSSITFPKDDKRIFKYKAIKIEGFAISCGKNNAFYLSLEEQDIAKNCINFLRTLFKNKQLNVKMFDAKEQIKLLKTGCDVDFLSEMEDPKIQDWLLEPEEKEKSLKMMAVEYGPQSIRKIADFAKSCKTTGSIGLYTKDCCAIDARLRASVEAILTWHVVDGLKEKLKSQMPKCQLHYRTPFVNTYELEMKTLICLANMELSGMPVNKTALQNITDLLKNQQNTIEKRAYSYAGRRFNFNSSTDVAKVTGMFNNKKVSTKKQALEKSKHPISELVLLWRKINFTLTQMVYPLIQAVEMNRIKGCYVTRTASGRISMHEPNLQTVTKDFTYMDPQKKTDITISCRSAFQAPQDHTLISADYCQLELRILTYLSKDKLLEGIMKKDGDVFKMIAAKWNNLEEDKVDDQMRQNTKQLCYGIFYGMGTKTLADQLNISEEEAGQFMESFKDTYPGIKEYIRKTISDCRKNGFLETLNGRRRYLPSINDSNGQKKGQAERQAINTTIQGSAADLVKNAMLAVEEKIAELFKKSSKKPILVLHLHDELIYETADKYVDKVAKIMKKIMVKSAESFGHFPVKVKTGKSWGELRDYQF